MTRAEPTSAPVLSTAAPGVARDRGRRVPTAAGLLVAALAFAAMAPTLRWLEFANGIEQLHAATVLEMRRPGGNWLMPTLNGALRFKKPPLPAWVGALAVADATMAGVGSPDPAARAAAFERLAWEVRWPALLAGCLAVVATFDLGRTIGGRRVGLAAAAVAATSLLFLRYVRLASTDVHLALWVSAANALLARALLRPRQAWCLVGVGAAVGLGVMCKGPVALLQTLVPAGVWALMLRGFAPSPPYTGDRAGVRSRASGVVRLPETLAAGLRPARLPIAGGTSDSTDAQVVDLRLTSGGTAPGGPSLTPALTPEDRGEGARHWSAGTASIGVPALLGLLAFLAIALPWPVLVWRSRPDALAVWWAEITRENATDHEYGPLWSYLSLLPNLLPWLPAVALGVWLTLRRWRPVPRRQGGERTSPDAAAAPEPRRPAAVHRGYLLALLWLVVPILVMSLVRDKSERYLLPMLPVAAVLGGRGLVAILAGCRRGLRPAGAWLAAHLVIVAVMAAGLPGVGMWSTAFARVDGSAWYPPALGLPAAVLGAAVIAAMFVLARRGRPAAALALSAVAMLGVNALLLWGYKDAPAGRSEMRPIAERILAAHPAATVAYLEPGNKPMPPDVSIYLNRVVRPLEGMRRRGEPDPDVIVTLQREGRPPPRIEGWRSFAAEAYGKRLWHAMERAGEEERGR